MDYGREYRFQIDKFNKLNYVIKIGVDKRSDIYNSSFLIKEFRSSETNEEFW